MDIYTFLNEILSIIFGVFMLLFHNSIGEYTARFQEKYMEEIYDENARRFTKIRFLILGLLFTISGIFSLFQKVQLR